MQHPDVASAFDLLEEAMVTSIDTLNAEGARLFQEGRYADVEKMSALAKGLGKLAAESRTLREKWETAVAAVLLPAPPRPNAPPPSHDGLGMEMRYNETYATAVYKSGSVSLKAGSTVRKPTYPSLSKSLREFRTRSQTDGTLIPTGRDDLLLLTQDIEFGSPSAAAQFVAGCSVSGNRDWRVMPTGMPLGEHLHQSQSQALCLRMPDGGVPAILRNLSAQQEVIDGPPPNDPVYADGATDLQRPISPHVPIDQGVDWDDVEIDLPEPGNLIR
jgi:hypothetical protein